MTIEAEAGGDVTEMEAVIFDCAAVIISGSNNERQNQLTPF